MLTVAEVNEQFANTFTTTVGITLTEVGPGWAAGRVAVRPDLINVNSSLHGGAIATLADATCSAGAMVNRPEGATSHATLEMKLNLLSPLRVGAARCEARLRHGGRTTQVWDAEVNDEESGAVLALFRCTMIMLSS